jgi:hypothetical protein
MPRWPRMYFCSTVEGPGVIHLGLLHQGNDLTGAPSPQTRDVSIKHQDKRYDGNDVGEEQMARRPPEIEWRYQQEERPE